LSILVIVKFSDTVTCALYHFVPDTEHFMDMIVEYQITKLLTWNFARSVTDLRYFLE